MNLTLQTMVEVLVAAATREGIAKRDNPDKHFDLYRDN